MGPVPVEYCCVAVIGLFISITDHYSKGLYLQVERKGRSILYSGPY